MQKVKQAWQKACMGEQRTPQIAQAQKAICRKEEGTQDKLRHCPSIHRVC